MTERLEPEETQRLLRAYDSWTVEELVAHVTMMATVLAGKHGITLREQMLILAQSALIGDADGSVARDVRGLLDTQEDAA